MDVRLEGGRTRLAGSIEAEHEQSHFLVAEQAAWWRLEQGQY
jgi:hypothetical protein